MLRWCLPSASNMFALFETESNSSPQVVPWFPQETTTSFWCFRGGNLAMAWHFDKDSSRGIVEGFHRCGWCTMVKVWRKTLEPVCFKVFSNRCLLKDVICGCGGFINIYVMPLDAIFTVSCFKGSKFFQLRSGLCNTFLIQTAWWVEMEIKQCTSFCKCDNTKQQNKTLLETRDLSYCIFTSASWGPWSTSESWMLMSWFSGHPSCSASCHGVAVSCMEWQEGWMVCQGMIWYPCHGFACFVREWRGCRTFIFLTCIFYTRLMEYHGRSLDSIDHEPHEDIWEAISGTIYVGCTIGFVAHMHCWFILLCPMAHWN